MPATMRSVFITGAGSGVGREGASLFCTTGWRVGAVDRNGDGLATPERERGLDMMWNNAGVGETGWFEDLRIRRRGASPRRIRKSLPALMPERQ